MLVFIYNYHFLRFVPFHHPLLSRLNPFRSLSLPLFLLSDGHTSRLMSILILDAKHPIHSLFNAYLCANRISLLSLCFSTNTSPDSCVVPLQLLDDCQLPFILSFVQSIPGTFDIMQKLSLRWSVGLSAHRLSFRLDSEEKSFQLAFLLVPEAIVAHFGLISRLTWVVSPEFGSS